MGTAHADSSDVSDLDLLNTASADATEAFQTVSASSDAPPINLTQLTDTFTKFEGIESPLLGSDNEELSGLGHLLFDAPDQQLSQTSAAFLSAAQDYTADPSFDNLLTEATTSFQFDGAMLETIPSMVTGKLVDQIFDLGDVDTAGSGAADLASAFDLPS